jgi:CHRD domain
MISTRRNLLVAGVGTAAAVAIALPFLPSGATTPSPTTSLAAQLAGANEVPPADANGVGDAFVFAAANDPQALCYVVIVDRIRPATMAHIHHGATGVNGPIVVPLRAPTDGDSAGCVQVREALVTRILNNPENFYVNVHNRPFPGGAIRGQLANN